MSNRTSRGSKLPDRFADAVGCPRAGGSKTGGAGTVKRTGQGGKKSAAKSSDPKETRRKIKVDDDIHASCKTPQVMKLIEKSGSGDNLVIMAGKSRVPGQLRGRESLSRAMKRGLGEEFSDEEDTTVVNLTELAIEYEAAEILDRFNACSCDRCVEVFSRKIAETVPARFARISTSRRSGSRELSERMIPVRKTVVSAMIRELICGKRRCFHDEET